MGLTRIDITGNEENQRLDRFIRKYMKDESLSNIYKLLRKGKVTVNGRKAEESYRLVKGDAVEIYAESGIRKTEVLNRADMNFSIVYEDKNIIAVDKPPGLILHPDNLHRENTLVDQVIYYLYKNNQYDPENSITFRPASVNRLDLNTGGIVIFAKNYPSLMSLNEMMRKRMMDKYYICIVKGEIVSEKEVSAHYIKDPKANKAKILYDGEDEGKAIHTRFIPLKWGGGYTLLEVDLITGRSHQIRAQLSSMGNPIAGDVKYGDDSTNRKFREAYGLKGQFLYAYRLFFKEALLDLKYLEGLSLKTGLPEKYKRIIRDVFKMEME